MKIIPRRIIIRSISTGDRFMSMSAMQLQAPGVNNLKQLSQEIEEDRIKRIKREGMYKRNIEHKKLIPFLSDEGKKIFKEALNEGGLEGIQSQQKRNSNSSGIHPSHVHFECVGSYWSLSENFVSQSDPSFCGLGTLAMVLNALHIDPGKETRASPYLLAIVIIY